MEENNVITTKKETLKEKIAHKREEVKAKREEKKAQKAENPNKINTKKIVLGLGGTALVIGSIAAAIATSKRCGSDEVYDPDLECEPGDDFPEIETTEEVNSEE